MAFTFSWRGAAAIAVVSMLIPASVQAQEIQTLDTVSGWDIIIDPSLNFGCAMQAEFEGGALVRMGFNKSDGHGYIMVFNQSWTDIVRGGQYNIGMNVDGQVWDGAAEGIILAKLPGVYIPFDNEAFFVDIMKKYTLTLKHQGRNAIVVSLDGTYNALEATMACQQGADSAR